MLKFLQFLYRFRSFLLFLILEIISFTLIVQNNNYQRAGFINSSNRVIANLLKVSNNVGDFFSLVSVNNTLAEENAELRNRVSQLEQSIFSLSTGEITDPSLINKYEIIEAKVVNNSVRQVNNYLTIEKGSSNGIEAGMSVLGPQGVVGKIKATSAHFSVMYSLLHSNMLISSRIERTADLSTVSWDGRQPSEAKLLYVPKHVIIQKGDIIVTSGFSSVFPANVKIGEIIEWDEQDNDTFYDITISLSTDFAKLSHVYVIGNSLNVEIDSLENTGN